MPQAFSTTSSRASDMAKLTLIGRLGRDPEVRTTKTEKEYVSYALASLFFSVRCTNIGTRAVDMLSQLRPTLPLLLTQTAVRPHSSLHFDKLCRRLQFYAIARDEGKTTWHSILSFSPQSNQYLRTLKKGSHVYVEANFEIREPDAGADPSIPQGQRSIFLRHGMYTPSLQAMDECCHLCDSAGNHWSPCMSY